MVITLGEHRSVKSVKILKMPTASRPISFIQVNLTPKHVLGKSVLGRSIPARCARIVCHLNDKEILLKAYKDQYISAIHGVTSMIGKYCSKHVKNNTYGTLGDARSHLNDRKILLKACKNQYIWHSRRSSESPQ